MRRTQQSGFSLIELMIVIVILGVLMAIAIPNYNGYLERTRRTDARGALLEIASAQERIYFERNQYTSAIADVWNYQEDGAYVSNEGHYVLSVVLTDDDTNRFTATATAQNKQTGDDDCATFSIDETGLKAATGDDPSGCW
jgi:type IV pilus assembly protein PilE